MVISSGLSKAQVQHFYEEGFLHVQQVLDPEEDLAPVLAEYAEVLETIAQQLLREGVIQ